MVARPWGRTGDGYYEPDPDPPVGTRVELLSSWPPERCRDALRAALGSPWSWSGNEPAVGTLHRWRLRACRRIDYRDATQTHLRADLVPDGSGTRIRCSFGHARRFTAFASVWLSMMLGIGSAIGTMTFVQDHTDLIPPAVGAWVGQVVPTVVLLLGAVLPWLVQLTNRRERRFLVEFVCATVDASPVG